ncbi:UBP-type zinc finger domain-containing protein [Streptomyces sp. MBT49]|uniref:UBP-type zinc finger domain-containing protein n=1 Tax=Streptomyces TaxID=1883 RepID=UPI00190D0F5A|nr:UBP-type zinc finger domain-containing protein [Streptomyces sp. MBT49]MBK3630249.1 UBP-type zinc finger domain-containing protein [Streptomyces sp. MBT49]
MARWTPRPDGGRPEGRECVHIETAAPEATPQSVVCRQCVVLGHDWVALRVCLTCGYVGCCDSSRHGHATAHFESSGHPLMRSAEHGDEWAWCYVDELYLQPCDVS